MKYLYQKDWETFARLFPDAQAFLIRCELWNEYVYLTNKPGKNDWETTRLAELDQHFSQQKELTDARQRLA